MKEKKKRTQLHNITVVKSNIFVSQLGDNYLKLSLREVNSIIIAKFLSWQLQSHKNKTCHKDRIARLTAPCPSHEKL